MESESFYGVTLSEKEPIAQFDVQEIPEEYVIHSYKLIIKQISLGVDAKPGEFNVIEAETKVDEKQTVKIPIAVLKAGETRILKPNVEFPNGSVTFKLLQGSGPVHVCGMAEMNLAETEWGPYSYMQSSEDEEDSDLELDEDVPPPQTNGKSNKKK